jgi:uncharacterized protein (DUF1800 family)
MNWTRDAAAHLVRRTAFGARKREVDAAWLDGSAEAAATRLVDDALALPLPAAPAGWDGDGVEAVYAIQHHWYEQMLGSGGLREKMTLFLHNLLAVQYATAGGAQLVWPYLQLLRRHALGNFRTLVYAIGVEPAMLRYLNGEENRAGAPNENYARELLELFTMGQTGPDGQPNYTEADIKEAARALTGWTVTGRGTASFDLRRHDRGDKTVLGQTGAWQHDDIVRIAFEQRAPAVAHFVCRKLVAFFVQAEPQPALVRDLAQAFVDADFELAPVVTRLLSSPAFYDPDVRAARVKTPLELLIGQMRELEISPNPAQLESVREALEPVRLGCELLNPPNVAGWPGLNPPASDGAPGHHAWLTTGTLPLRWDRSARLLSAFDPLELATKVSVPTDPFRLAIDLAELLLPLPLDATSAHRPASADHAFSMCKDVPPQRDAWPAHKLNLLYLLLDGTPWCEWPGGASASDPAAREAVRELLRRYIGYLTELPEYQLT